MPGMVWALVRCRHTDQGSDVLSEVEELTLQLQSNLLQEVNARV